jgi:hypothetical protein
VYAEVTENNSFKNPSLTNESFDDTDETLDPRSELHGWHLTWGATPLNFNGKQMDIYKVLNKRIERGAPKSTPLDVRKFVSQHFMSRFFQRQNRNSKSFSDRGSIVIDNLDEQYHEILCAAIDGSSNPNDLLKLREKLDMPSIELARLTHPYGTHMETLDEMRQAIDFAIESNGGELIDDDSMTTYGVDGGHIRDKGENIELGFLMKRKRVRGILPDGTVIIERSTFVLRVDKESRLDQDIARQFRSIKIDKNPDWNKQVMEVINAYNLMPKLLSNDEFDIAIPLSTTTYAFNPQRVYELEEVEKEKRIPKGTAEERFDRARANVASEVVLRALNSNYPTESR